MIMDVAHYENLEERISYLDMTNSKKVIYSILVPELAVDDILILTSAFEVTNNNNINVMIGSDVRLSDSSNSVDGIILDRAYAFNVTPGMHHGVMMHARQYKVKKNCFNKYINLVVWSASDEAIPGMKLVIEKGYGHLDITIIK